MESLSTQSEEDALEASGPIIEDITELCKFCVRPSELIVEAPKNEAPEDIGGKLRVSGVVLDPDEESCRLCDMISSVWSVARPVASNDLKKHLTTGGYITGLWSCEEQQVGRRCRTRLGSHLVATWADKGSAACTTLVERPPILGPDMKQFRDLIQYWRKMCSNHENCQPENDTLMPTRVLALCGDYARPSVNLVQTRGQRGRYIALSHCWGSIEKQPLRTTSENFEVHQEGIAFADLPKTFRDVVELAQALGIRYVWIDSLCIIQGNREDWQSEAKKRRDVYRNAAIVVCASGAKDSTEGLFISNRPRATVFRLPYSVAGDIKGTFSMTQSPGEDCFPLFGALETRAWTFQERFIATQCITFMPGGITWTCQTTSLDETEFYT